MAIDLKVFGPGLDTVRLLHDGEPELVLGRDADCGICLPDPQRNVSRRHLSVWSKAGELHFRVLSVVNGVEMPFGEAPPGAQGVLPFGQMARLGDYTFSCTLHHELPAAAPAEPADPWAVFDREGSGIATLPPALRKSVPVAGASAPTAEDDPFGDWGFETTFAPGSRAGPLEAVTPGAAAPDVAAFFSGLGLDPAQLGPMSPGEVEAVGRMVRIALQGLLKLQASASELAGELRAEDRTMIASKDSTPLKSDWPMEAKLQYLFGGRNASVGLGNPEKALQELLVELVAHEAAMGLALRSVVEGTLAELSPGVLKTHLLGTGSKLFEAARLWDAYSKYHAEQAAQMPGWVQRLFDKYFTGAYMRETARIKREASARPK